MPLPLLILLAGPVVQGLVGAAAAAGIGGFAAKKYAESKSSDQAAEARALAEGMTADLDNFKKKLEPLAHECLDLCGRIVEQAISVMVAASVAQPWNGDETVLDESTRSSLKQLDGLNFVAINHKIAAVKDTDFANAWKGVSGGHMSAVQRVAPQLMPLVAVAWAGSMVMDAGSKLMAVSENEKSLNGLRTLKAERSREYDAGLKSALKEIEIIDSVARTVLPRMRSISASAPSRRRDAMLRAIYSSLARVSPID